MTYQSPQVICMLADGGSPGFLLLLGLRSERCMHAQVLQEGIPQAVLEADTAWEPALPVRELRKLQLQGQHAAQKQHGGNCDTAP